MKVDINKIKNLLLIKYPLFGSVVVNLNYIESKDCKTLGTDGKNIFYNLSYLESLTEDEQTFLFAHEVCHVAFDHILRSKNRDNRVWNIASDAVINAFLEKDGLSLVKGSVFIPGAINYNVEDLYNKILKDRNNGSFNKYFLSKNNYEEAKKEFDKKEEKEGKNKNKDLNKIDNKGNDINKFDKSYNKEKKQNKIKSSTKDLKVENKEINRCNNLDKNQIDRESIDKNIENEMENTDVGHDTHRMWKKTQEKIDNKTKMDQDDFENCRDGNLNKIDEIDHEIIGKYDLEKDLKEAIKDISQLEEIDAFVQNTNKKEKNLEEIKENMLNKAFGTKKATVGANRIINKMENDSQIINWKKILTQTLNYNIDWSYENAYIEDGILKANLEELKKPETEILLDTSGSINETVLKNFLKECKNILKSSNMKVGCFDTKFYGFKKIDKIEDINNFDILGHGGTNYYTAVKSFSRQAENKIIFTDGKAQIPENTKNIIWIVFGDEKISIKNGKVIYIRNEDLRKLYINKIA